MLTSGAVADLRRAARAGARPPELAERFSVSRVAAWAAATGESWRGVDEAPAIFFLRSGEAHPRAVLTADLVREIRASSESTRALADRLGVSRSAVRHARAGRTWAWLDSDTASDSRGYTHLCVGPIGPMLSSPPLHGAGEKEDDRIRPV